jgi:uncharacterized protein (TIGR03067 family)
MRRKLILVVASSFLLAAADKKEDPVKKDLAKLQGTWTMTALEVDGKPVPEDKLTSSTLTIKGDKYIIKVEDNTYKCTIKLDPSKDPKEIDMTFLDGPNKDKTGKGIYVLEKDTFKICRALDPGKDRPQNLGTWPDTGVFMVTWKRKAK